MLEPLPGNRVYRALMDQRCIVLACNPRVIPGVAHGIFRAAKELDAPLIMELARTECNQHVGYTGLTPAEFSRRLNEVNEEVGHNVWVLHADHIGVKTGTRDDIADVKEMIGHQIAAGYTSFAIDASHLFDFDGGTVAEELAPNIKATIEIAGFIRMRMSGREFGLECEVGEIGRTGDEGMVLTTPEEATTFIGALGEAGVHPQLLAIANGSTHGNVYDAEGNPIAQVTIDIERTKAVARALREAGHDVRIAQHGITGTPLDLIRERFPRGDILKGNVATLYQNIVLDAIKEHHNDLWWDMRNWTIAEKPIAGKRPEEVFGKNVKFALKEFFDEIYAMGEACEARVERECHRATMDHILAFGSAGKAAVVRERLDG
ncbi:MAG: class II fructose-bisphosphate aldolase [Thermoplasmata archaeon]|nr:class II fructose-bisphosphate aldolase [Thermoplasmata archaeon]